MTDVVDRHQVHSTDIALSDTAPHYSRSRDLLHQRERNLRENSFFRFRFHAKGPRREGAAINYEQETASTPLKALVGIGWLERFWVHRSEMKRVIGNIVVLLKNDIMCERSWVWVHFFRFPRPAKRDFVSSSKIDMIICFKLSSWIQIYMFFNQPSMHGASEIHSISYNNKKVSVFLFSWSLLSLICKCGFPF